jgi:hypothetical protein
LSSVAAACIVRFVTSRRNEAPAKLAGVASIQMGYPFRSRLEHDPAGEVAVIQMRDLDEANLLAAGGFLRTTLPDGKSPHFVHAGDLLFRSRGLSNGAVQVPEEIGPAVVAAPMLRIRPRKVLPAYLCWFLNAPATQDRLSAMAEGTSVQMIRVGALKGLEIPLPPESVQRRIAEAAALADREGWLMSEIARRRQRVAAHLLMTWAQQESRKGTP